MFRVYNVVARRASCRIQRGERVNPSQLQRGAIAGSFSAADLRVKRHNPRPKAIMTFITSPRRGVRPRRPGRQSRRATASPQRCPPSAIPSQDYLRSPGARPATPGRVAAAQPALETYGAGWAYDYEEAFQNRSFGRMWFSEALSGIAANSVPSMPNRRQKYQSDLTIVPMT